MKTIRTYLMSAVLLAAVSLAVPAAFAAGCCKEGAACCKEDACCKKSAKKSCCKKGAACCTDQACARNAKK